MDLKIFSGPEWAALLAAFSAVAVTASYVVVQLVDYLYS